MRVQIVDPSAYTPPYDHALCRALAAAALPGTEVELFTSRFAYDAAPVPEGYARREFFYRRAHRGTATGRRSRSGLALKAAEHVPDMLRYRRAARAADVVHFQWLTLQPLDVHLLPRRSAPGRHRSPARPRALGGRVAPGGRPKLVLTAHDVLPREPRPGQLAAQRRLYERMDAVVVHTEHGATRLREELGLAAELVHVIPHGVLRPWESRASATAGLPGERQPEGRPPVDPLPPDFADARGPVVLFFGLLRPYKGLDLLLEAWREMPDGDRAGAVVGAKEPAPHRTAPAAELWIVGMPRMDMAPLHEAAAAAERAGAGRVRFLERFVSDAELGAFMARASLLVAPYREIEQSGVAFTALGAGTPLLLSDAGGFPELAATGAAQIVAGAGASPGGEATPGADAPALAAALAQLLGEPARLAAMSARAREAAEGPYSWAAIARAHLALYEALLAE